MSVFSEMGIDSAAERDDKVAPFILEPQLEIESAEIFGDDAMQRAEAQTAPAALAYLKQQDEDELCTDESETEEEPAEVPLTPAQKKQAHEEAEARRKAEWEAKRQEKEEAELMACEIAVSVSDEELVSASMGRIGKDAERLTRRNMKVCVAEHIQTKCLEDMGFARQTMHPRKNMINCYRYINRMALEFIKKEMAENDEKPSYDGFGGDVPDDICYQWAEDYFNDLDAQEDKGKDDKFVPKPYTGPSPSKPKKTASKKAEKKVQPNAVEKASELPENSGQMSLLGGVAV
ncbi:Cas9 inhibitor AcrIIA9 family protein [Anaerotignum sp.]|uniref:Cas9 inhibitor AcrIIA9 family protein n=1 Tax=Anaerotignum sp. TaxID=2039241 RepID=UPI0028A91718|nr:Cas9 inhibitor AcrIIA9 family protein [Anaerotignum sp.]